MSRPAAAAARWIRSGAWTGVLRHSQLAQLPGAPARASSLPVIAVGSAVGAGVLGFLAWRRWASDEEVDFIVIGAGSSGCAIAARLKEGLPHLRVLLLEAGADDDLPEIQTAVDYFGKVERVFTTDRDWGHGTGPQPGLGGRGLYWPRGKVVGGCSSFNTMVWMRPGRDDLNRWAEIMHDDAWGYAGLLPYFRRAETHPLAESDPGVHGGEGPIMVARLDHAQHGNAAHHVTRTFVDTAVALGHRPNPDFGAGTTGVGLNDVNATGGRRCGTAAYLRRVGACPGAGERSARSGNLEVRLLTQAMRLIFDGHRAVGVEVCEDAHEEGRLRRTIRARREVILCGGAVNSPQLLLLSGVGPPAHLEELGIPVVAASPGVGQGLQDHLHVAVSYTLPEGLKPHPQSNICEGSLFTRLARGPGVPDLQVHCGVLFFEPDGFYPSGEGFTLTPSLIRPQSVGHMTLRSADPFDKPEICPNYLADERDVQQLCRGVRIARAIGTEMVHRLGGQEVHPGPGVQTDAEVEAYVRRYAGTMYHPAASCRAGPDGDKGAVLDAEFRVRGVEALRVVDASAMPELVGANTNATCVALGERAAELLVKEHRK